MKLHDYFTDHLFSVICFLISNMLASSFLWLIEIPAIFIVFLETIFLTAFLICFMWDFLRRKSYYNKLFKTLNTLEEITLLSEVSEYPRFLDGQIILEILRRSNKYQNDKISDIYKHNRDYREYLNTWVHEIKTPIASARLIVENEKNIVTLKIDDELRKIDGFVEQVLYYARSTAVEKDFKIQNTTLKEMVTMALKNYSNVIIQAGGKLHINEIDIPVCADIKGCAFIIGQIISNSIKYRKDNLVLSFDSKTIDDYICLSIADNGIGIVEADLSRVFDKGFTGNNGRQFSKSTGIGLYLCKEMCDKMNMKISIYSAQGKGTTVALYFPIERLIPKAGE